jgi:hypothetical protein
MRVSVVALVLALGLLAGPPTAHGQTGALVLEDAEGDQETTLGDAIDLPPGLRGARADLHRLTWQETPVGFTLALETAALQEPPADLLVVDSVSYTIFFTYSEADYAVLFEWWPSDPLPFPAFFDAFLTRYDATEERYVVVMPLEATIDLAGLFTTTVPREAIAGADGRALALADAITGIHVSAASGFALCVVATVACTSYRVIDAMPDDGTASWTVQWGIEQRGHVRLGTDRPFRVSNGEATTFLYDIRVHNDADFPDTVTLSGEGAPEHWTVTVPRGDVRLEAHDDRTVPVLVTVPFAHRHDEVHAMTLQARSASDPTALAQLQIGVRYTAVPQPAGHHNHLRIHLGEQGPYMNTAEDDAGDAGTPAHATSESGNAITVTYEWWVPLVPSLQMGLAMDEDGVGRLVVPFAFPVGGLQTTLSADLLIAEGPSASFLRGEETIVAQAIASGPIDAAPGSAHTFELEVRPAAGSVRIDFEPQRNLLLVLALQTTSAFGLSLAAQSPAITPGGSLDLPLLEYHDEVDEFFTDLSGLALRADGAQQRLVNPDETVVFRIHAENLADRDATFDLTLSGSDPTAARVLGPTTVKIPGGATRDLAVAVRAPADGADTQIVDIALHATLRGDADVHSLIRLLAEIDTDVDHADEAGAAESADKELEERPAAWPAAALFAAVLVAAAVSRRR